MQNQITIKPDQNKNYNHVDLALLDHGFIFESKFLGAKNAVGNSKTYRVYWNGQDYYYLDNYDHFNGTVYSVRVKVLPNPLGHYQEV